MVVFLMVIEDENIRNKLEELYLLYHKEMFYVANNILNDYYEAEDAVQNAILKISSQLEKISQVKCNKTRAFLVIIVRNISINIYRQRKSRSTTLIDDIEIMPDDDITPELHVIRLEDAEKIAKLLAKIDSSYADILALKYFYEYSNTTIANLLDLKEGNVRVKLHRARQAMKKLLLEEGGVVNEAN
ncbi:MAG: RNA polymerase sigma factor [Vallitalea sp.]|jgi:RNA polymerase sigma-70 factor (ECF subfamily)|nr:RNA polymerase sigma factor [Vallitalea sp.]